MHVARVYRYWNPDFNFLFDVYSLYCFCINTLADTVKKIVMDAQRFSATWSQVVVISQLLVWGQSVGHVLLASLEMETSA